MRHTLHNAKKRLEELEEATTNADPRGDVELDDREAAAIQRYLRERRTTDEEERAAAFHRYLRDSDAQYLEGPVP